MAFHAQPLVGVGETAQALTISEDVPRSCKTEHGEVATHRSDIALCLFAVREPAWTWNLIDALLHVERQFNVVDTREIHAARRLRLLRMKCSRPAVDECIGDVGVVLVRFYESEVPSFLRGEAWEIVELEVHHADWVLQVLAGVAAPVVDVVLALASHGPDELDDGVVEVETHAHLARPGADLVGLHLGDELLEGAGGEPIALVDIEVHVSGLDERAQILLHERVAVVPLKHQHGVRLAGVAGRLHTRLQVREAHVQLDPVELEGDHWQRVARSLREPERQRHVQPSVVGAVIDQVAEVVLLADHLPQLLTGLARQLFPHIEVVGVESINNLSSDDKAGSTNEELANRVSVVAPRLAVLADVVGVLAAIFVVFVVFVDSVAAWIAVSSIWTGRQPREWLGIHLTSATLRTAIVASLDAKKINDNISPENQITSTIEGQLRVASEHHLRIERLFDSLARKVGVLVVTEAPERNACILCKVLVRGPKSYKLCEGSSLTC